MSRWRSSQGAKERRVQRLSVQTVSLLMASLVIAEPALAQELVVAGHLSCEIQRLTGLPQVQRQRLTCSFFPTGTGTPSRFRGELMAMGRQIGISERLSVVWQVLVAKGANKSEVLTGTYANAASANQIESTLLKGGPEGATYLRVVSVNGLAEPNFATLVSGLSLRRAH